MKRLAVGFPILMFGLGCTMAIYRYPIILSILILVILTGIVSYLIGTAVFSVMEFIERG